MLEGKIIVVTDDDARYQSLKTRNSCTGFKIPREKQHAADAICYIDKDEQLHVLKARSKSLIPAYKELAEKLYLNNKGPQIKEYKDVEVGDQARDSIEGDYAILGKIVFKGTYSELMESNYKSTVSDWEDMEPEDFDEYDLVVVHTTGWDAGPRLFNYNNDPSGCVTFK